MTRCLKSVSDVLSGPQAEGWTRSKLVEQLRLAIILVPMKELGGDLLTLSKICQPMVASVCIASVPTVGGKGVKGWNAYIQENPKGVYPANANAKAQ